MANSITVAIPDIGNFDSVDIIDILVNIGDEIKKEDPIITVESDKASMDIPSPADGVITKILIKVGDTVKQGSPIIEVKSTEVKVQEPQKEIPVAIEKKVVEKSDENGQPMNAPSSDLNCDVAVLGSGPGGYTAAFREIGRAHV